MVQILVGALTFIDEIFGIGDHLGEFGIVVGFGIGGISSIGFFIVEAFNWCAAVYTAWIKANDVISI